MVSTRKAKYFAWSNDGDSGHQFEALDRVPSSSFCRKPTWEKQRRESVTGKDFFFGIQRPPFCALVTEKGLFFVNSLLLTVKNLADLRKTSESRD